MVYFSLALSILFPFFHDTAAALVSSQRRAAVWLSVACRSFSSSLKSAGRAEGHKTDRGHEKMTCGTQVTGGMGWYTNREHFRVERVSFPHNSGALDKQTEAEKQPGCKQI